MRNKISQISASNYQKVLSEIQKQIVQTQKNILNNVTRQKVEMAWKVGQIIDKALLKNDEKSYGAKLIQKLEQDVGIKETTLYKMRSFYKTYPKIPKDDERLNWSHYRVLSGVKKADERKYLEDLTRENSWNSEDLQKEVSKNKVGTERGDGFTNAFPRGAFKKAQKKVVKKIKPARGKLFSYKITKIAGSKKYFLDCGFGVFREVKEALPRALKKDGAIVSVKKNGENYSFKKSQTAVQQLHAYVAYLEKFVDGDTIRVNLDLGFGIFHHEILRLAKINAPEIKTVEGKKSAQVIQKILKDVPFFVIKSIKTDIYGRYVADVFLAKKNSQAAADVAESGAYLNQLLLDAGAAEIF